MFGKIRQRPLEILAFWDYIIGCRFYKGPKSAFENAVELLTGQIDKIGLQEYSKFDDYLSRILV